MADATPVVPKDGAEDHAGRRQAERPRQPDHPVHRRRRHGPRHLARERARVRCGGREGVRRQEEDRVARGLAGEKAFKQTNNWLPDETVEAFRKYLVGIKGPLTTPIGGGIRSLNVALRQMLDLYVCLRPVRWFKGVPSPVKRPQEVDMVIFRENTEDIYAGIEWEAESRRGARRCSASSRRSSRRTSRRSASPARPASASSRSRRRAPSASCARRSSTRSSTSARASRSSTRATS